MTELERRYFGNVEVDSGTLLVADPCYVLPQAADSKPGVDYQAVLDSDLIPHANRIGGKPVILLSNFGGDGSFPVFGEFDEGELVGIWINLAPPDDDDDEEDEE